MSLIPFRFGTPGQQLFGALHAQNMAPARLGVLLCNPLGQEAVRIHRFYRVLADRLAQAGIPTLRFDYYGTGDADGDDLDGDLTRWCADIGLAQQALLQRIACQQVAWFGARLGGTLAAMASSQVERAPDILALWEPIVEGPAYLRELAVEHVALVSSDYRRPEPSPGLEPHGEALGLGMSPALIEQIRRIPPQVLEQVHCQELIIVSQSHNEPPNTSATSRQSAMPKRRRHLPLQVPFDWTSEEALNTALVPPVALQLLTRTLQGCAT
ncbi:MAG: hypothetical protein KGL57_04340 [Burkholderiales bacterium]|nr:hypothetical protein [Burkholderiales bacterium]